MSGSDTDSDDMPEYNIGWLITIVDRINYRIFRIDQELKRMYPTEKDTRQFFELEYAKVKWEEKRDTYKEMIKQKIDCPIRYESDLYSYVNIEKVRDGENSHVKIITKTPETCYFPKTFRNRGS